MAYFQTKNPKWVHFGGSCNGRCCHILWPFGQFYCHLVYFGKCYLVYFPVLVRCTKKNLAALRGTDLDDGRREVVQLDDEAILATNLKLKRSRGRFLTAGVCP
jgi:hypothetical protein